MLDNQHVTEQMAMVADRSGLSVGNDLSTARADKVEEALEEQIAHYKKQRDGLLAMLEEHGIDVDINTGLED